MNEKLSAFSLLLFLNKPGDIDITISDSTVNVTLKSN